MTIDGAGRRGLARSSSLLEESNARAYARAIADLSRAIEIKPDYAEAYHDRGLVYDAMNDPDRATADLRKAVEINIRFGLESELGLVVRSKNPEIGKKLVVIFWRCCSLRLVARAAGTPLLQWPWLA